MLPTKPRPQVFSSFSGPYGRQRSARITAAVRENELALIKDRTRETAETEPTTVEAAAFLISEKTLRTRLATFARRKEVVRARQMGGVGLRIVASSPTI